MTKADEQAFLVFEIKVLGSTEWEKVKKNDKEELYRLTLNIDKDKYIRLERLM